jgi:hypothetical protein
MCASWGEDGRGLKKEDFVATFASLYALSKIL